LTVKTYYKNKNWFVMELPSKLIKEDSYVRDFLNYLKIKEIISKSKIKKKDINLLSEEIKFRMWENNKERILKEIKNEIL